jgi:hypothetical protein
LARNGAGGLYEARLGDRADVLEVADVAVLVADEHVDVAVTVEVVEREAVQQPYRIRLARLVVEEAERVE